jgi:hypothetical protein
MFKVPEAKRVKRTEFFEEDVHLSEGESEDNHEAVPAYGFEYDFIDVKSFTPNSSLATHAKHSDDAHKCPKEEKRPEQKFEFNLFAPSTDNEAKATQHAKISLRASPSPGDALSEGRFIKPNRSDTYYFTSSLSQSELRELRSQYLTSAVTSNEISRRSKAAWPGMKMEWRIIAPKSVIVRRKRASSEDTDLPADTNGISRIDPKIEIHNNSSSEKLLPPVPVSTVGRRTKPSKKRRILLRKRIARQTKLTGEANDQAIREKKSAMNRKNKLRRREKEREKKNLAERGQNRDGG